MQKPVVFTLMLFGSLLGLACRADSLSNLKLRLNEVLEDCSDGGCRSKTEAHSVTVLKNHIFVSEPGKDYGTIYDTRKKVFLSDKAYNGVIAALEDLTVDQDYTTASIVGDRIVLNYYSVSSDKHMGSNKMIIEIDAKSRSCSLIQDNSEGETAAGHYTKSLHSGSCSMR